MLRKLSAILAALIVTTGLTLVLSSGADAKSVLPRHGAYTGVDHAGRMVSLTFAGNQMSYLSVGHQQFGNAHVSNGAWHETCAAGYCSKGTWVSDSHVTGSWRVGGSAHWTHFSAYLAPGIRPYAGPHMGRDLTGLAIHLNYSHGAIRDFKLDHSVRGNIQVHNAAFETCLSSICVKGHWQSDYSVVGWWRPVNGTRWVSWEAFAYAS